MARINTSDLIDQLTGNEPKSRFVNEIIIKKLLINIRDHIAAGNVVNLNGIGTLYKTTKKKRDGLEIYETSPQIYDTTFIWHANVQNLKPFQNLPPDPYKVNPPFDKYAYPVYDIKNYTALKFKASKKLETATETIRLKKVSLKRMRTKSGDTIYAPIYQHI